MASLIHPDISTILKQRANQSIILESENYSLGLCSVGCPGVQLTERF